MRGAGDTMTPMWISLITTVAVRVPVAYILNFVFHNSACVFISLLFSWLTGALLTVIFYRRGKWKKKALR